MKSKVKPVVQTATAPPVLTIKLVVPKAPLVIKPNTEFECVAQTTNSPDFVIFNILYGKGIAYEAAGQIKLGGAVGEYTGTLKSPPQKGTYQIRAVAASAKPKSKPVISETVVLEVEP